MKSPVFEVRLYVWSLIAVIITLNSGSAQNSWKEMQIAKKGSVTVYWFPNNPFGYKDQAGRMAGIEVEIVKGLQKHLQKRYKIDLSFKWVEENTFLDVMDHIKSDTIGQSFGVAGFSFSMERRAYMKFSPSYMADMAVLVSTPDIPIVRSKEDLKKYLDGTTAFTAKGTILEKDLVKLKNENGIDFKIEYTGASTELINTLKGRTKSFGYINLPIYLMNIDHQITKLNRQNYLTKKYEGRGIGLPKVSDWDIPFQEYFESVEFKQNIENLIGQYINLDLYHFVETLSPENEVGLLTKEKSLQENQLSIKDLIIKNKTEQQFILIIIIFIITALTITSGSLAFKLRNTNRLLKEQKAEIESQANEIGAINDNLEALVNQRTMELKNKNEALEEYAFITAHKLRAPLASILGLISLIEKMKWEEEDKMIFEHLKLSSEKLDEIIHLVMGVIEKSEEIE